jgi:hypothetical protein
MTKVHHYVYKIEFKTGHVYYGSRSCKCLPKDDTSYLGSPRTNKVYWDENTPVKVILREFNTREEANVYEGILIEWCWSVNKSLSLNANIGGVKFCTQGKVLTDDDKISIVKPFYVVSPEGKVFEGVNLAKFCKENNLDNTHTGRVISGQQLHHKGWTASLAAHKVYLEYYRTRGVGRNGSGWSVRLGSCSGKTKCRYFTTKEAALEFRDSLLKEGKEFFVKPVNWKEKLQEVSS